jgi:hypothetical protein
VQPRQRKIEGATEKRARPEAGDKKLREEKGLKELAFTWPEAGDKKLRKNVSCTRV